MIQPSPIISTKLQSPRISNIIRREKFIPHVSQFKEKQLITVTAGAGYGKTTLIADALEKLRVKSVWYRLDTSDADFVTFLQYLVVGVKNIYTDFGNELLSIINSPQGVDRKPAFLLTLFINDLERVCNKNLFFILDDFHLVNDNPDIKSAVEFILYHLPNRVHLVLISRSAIDLKRSRLKGMREMLDIDETDLCLNDAEIEKLFSEIFDLSISTYQAGVLYKKTKGWISGLILFYHMLKGKTETEMETFLRNLTGSRGEIYTYLEENIYDQLASRHQLFLIKTSILSRLSPDFCDRFLDISGSRKILTFLEANHLFAFSLDNEKEEYVYHDLFKDFLRAKLKEQSHEAEIEALYAKAADMYEKKGEYSIALDCYLESGQIDEVSRLLAIFARTWIKQGRIRKVKSLLERIPESYREKDPWFLFLQAGLLELSGKAQAAVSGYGRAMEVFRAQSSDWGLEQCLIEQATYYFNQSEFVRAEPLFKELLSRKTLSPILRIVCLGSLMGLSVYLGKLSDTDQYTEEAMSLLKSIPDKRIELPLSGWIYTNIGRRLFLEGHLRDSIEAMEKALKVMAPTDQYRVIVICDLILSEAFSRLGQFEKARDSALHAMTLMKKIGFKDALSPNGLLKLGYNCFSMGRLEEARSFGQKSASVYHEMNDPSGEANAYILLYLICLQTGEMQAAEQCIHQGIKIIKNLNFPMQQSRLDVCRARIMIEKGEVQEALPLLKNAEKTLQCYRWYYASILLGYTRCHQKRNQMDPAMHSLLQTLSFCEENEYDLLLVWQRKWIVVLLVELFARGEKQEYISNLLLKMGSDAVGEISRMIENSQNPLVKKAAIDLSNELHRHFSKGLTLQFFGTFKISRGEAELPANTWKSKKALQLFKYLVYSRNRGYLNKEVLMELLWPDEDPKKSSNSFHVALNAMRKVLDPDLPKSVPSTYILSDQGSYRIDIGKKGSVDVEKFSQEIKQAKNSTDPETSIDHYLKAISLYAGDFLEEDLYMDWCGEVREQFKDDYLSAIKEVTRYYEQQEAFDKCIAFASMYLRTDKYAEEIYQLLMRCYSRLGDNAMGIKTFKKCRDHIMNDLNCPLSRETLELYEQLNPN